MKNKVDISIIIPAYNVEKHIKKCLDSITQQTKKELEIIVINDGSTDHTEKIVKGFQDERIKYFKNKNQGIGKTRNFGIEKATGKYLMFVDSDDYLEKEACEELYNKIEEGLDLVVCDFYREYGNEKILEKIPDFSNGNLKKNPSLLNCINLGPCNKIYLTKRIKESKIMFIEDLKYEDAPFVVMALVESKKIGKLNKPLHNYVIHEQSETTIRNERCFDILKIMDRIRNYAKNQEYLTEELNKLTVRMITNYTIQQRYQADKIVAMKFIDEAFEYLEKEVPDYKLNKYYHERGFFRRIIEKSKGLTKLYINGYRLFHKER